MEDNNNDFATYTFEQISDMEGMILFQADQHVVLYYEYLLQQDNNRL